MKRITLTLMALLAAISVATAQDPTPPARPVPAPRPARPTDARPVIAPMAPMTPFIDQEAVREMAREAVRNIDPEMIRANIDMARAHAELARESVNIDAAEIRRSAELAMRDMRIDIDFPTPMPRIAPMAPMPAMTIEPRFAPMAIARDFTDRMPPAAWAQGDPADSLYRIARDALGRGDYGRAARTFSEITQKYPKSVYQSEAPYYEALARYKVGTTDELKQAAKVLEPLVKTGTVTTSSSTNVPGQFTTYTLSRRNTSDSEILALYIRINSALAQRGDGDARKRVEGFNSPTGSAPCDQEDIQVRTEALNALSQMDPAGALPSLRKVLERKDECNASLRRNAVFILARRNDAESSALLLTVAKTDPNIGVRSEAINFLARTPGESGIAALEEILRTEQDERIQRAAVRALMNSDSPRARASMRALIDRKDAPINLRIEAINSLNSDRATQEDMKYLRDLYARADNDAMKRAIIDAVGRMGGAESDQWVLAIARNNNESSSIRATAMSRLYRSNITIVDLNKLYDTADSREIRQQIINILQGRKEPEAADKLVEIVKTGTDVKLRGQAINALQRKNDPRSAQLFLDILDGKRP
jgi:HEAT repeat protein/TolA-binding protein